jgi:hypothetical protein
MTDYFVPVFLAESRSLAVVKERSEKVSASIKHSGLLAVSL